MDVTVFTDHQGKDWLDKKGFSENIITFEPTYSGLKQKAKLLIESPYNRTLFIDTDTEVKGELSVPFGYLDKYDICIAGMRWMDFSENPPKLIGFEKPHPTRSEYIFFNTGVIYYKLSDRFIKFHGEWLSSISDRKPNEKHDFRLHCDQYHFNEMLTQKKDLVHELKIKIIPNTEYNCRPLFFKRLKEEGRLYKVKIIHEHNLNRPLYYHYIQFKKKIGKRLREMKFLK